MGLAKRLRKQLARLYYEDRTPVNTMILIQHGVLGQDGKSEGRNFKNVVNKGKKK